MVQLLRSLLITLPLSLCLPTLAQVTPVVPAPVPAPATIFATKADVWQVIGGGLPTTATLDFRIFVRGNATMGFDVRPHLPPGAELGTIILKRCQSFCDGNISLYQLCGGGSGNPRPTCSQTGYVNTNGGELVASDILPYGHYTDIKDLLDLMRHRMVYVEITYKALNDTGFSTIRGNLIPQ